MSRSRRPPYLPLVVGAIALVIRALAWWRRSFTAADPGRARARLLVEDHAAAAVAPATTCRTTHLAPGGAGPPPPTRRRSVSVAIGAAMILAVGPLLPGPLRWATIPACLIAPGWSVLNVMFPGSTRPDRATSLTLSVGLSMAVAIAAGLGLDAVGLSLSPSHVGLVLAAVVVCSLARPEPPASRGAGRGGPARALGPALGATITAGVVIWIHALAPASADPPFASISFASAAGTDSVAAVSSGVMRLEVVVRLHGTVGGPLVLATTLDGQPLDAAPAGPIGPTGVSSVDVEAMLPSLDRCVHRIEVGLVVVGRPVARSLTRYVSGAGGPGCGRAP